MDLSWYEKIEDYLNGTMNQRLQFESEMASNEELLTLFKIYSTIENEMRNDQSLSSEEAILKESIQKLNEKYFIGTAIPNSPVSEKISGNNDNSIGLEVSSSTSDKYFSYHRKKPSGF